MVTNGIIKTFTGIIVCFAIAMAQGSSSDSLRALDSSSSGNDTAVQSGAVEKVVTTGVDSTAIKAQLFENNRLKAAALDDSIASCRSLRPLCVLGIIAGATITVVGMVLAQNEAQEKANELAMETGGTAYAWAWNIPGLLVGMPLTALCTYKYVTLGSKISVYEWKKKKLKLSVSGNGAILAGSF